MTCNLHKKYAFRDLHLFCKDEHRFPLGKNIKNFLGEKNVFKVKRTSGAIEDNWTITFNFNDFTNHINDNELMIPVHKISEILHKGVVLKEFCELNNLDLNDFLIALENDLADIH